MPSCVAIGCYDTNKLGIPGEDADGVLDGLEYLRIATLGLPYPGHDGTRVVVVGGGFTSMDCSRTSVRQGAKEVTLVYRRDMKDMPAANEVHEMIEEGARAIFQAAPDARRHGRQQQGHGHRVPAHGAGRARCLRPAPTGAARGHGVHHRVRPGAAGHRPGPRPDLDRRAARRASVPPSSAAWRPTRSPSRPAGPGVFGTGDVRTARRPWSRRGRGPTRGLRHRRLPQGHGPGGDPDAPDAGRAAARVPVHRALHERGQGAALRLKALPAEVRNKSYIEYEIPYTQQEAMAESDRCLQCTCEAIGYCDLRRQGIEYGTTLKTLEPQSHRDQLPERVREPLHGHQPRLRPRRQPRVHPARAVALHRLRPLRQRVQGGRGRRLLRLHADRLRHPGHDAAGHEPQHDAVRVLRPVRRDVPDGRADAQAARAREVRGRREPLHPVRHLRRRVPLRRAARQRPDFELAHDSRARSR